MKKKQTTSKIKEEPKQKLMVQGNSRPSTNMNNMATKQKKAASTKSSQNPLVMAQLKKPVSNTVQKKMPVKSQQQILNTMHPQFLEAQKNQNQLIDEMDYQEKNSKVKLKQQIQQQDEDDEEEEDYDEEETKTFKNNLLLQNKIKNNNQNMDRNLTKKINEEDEETKTFKNNYKPQNYQEDDKTIVDEMQQLQLENTYSRESKESKNNWSNLDNYNQCSQQFHELLNQIKQKCINIIAFKDIQNDGQVIGEGGFGSVYLGRWSGIKVAIKEMLLSYSEFKTMDSEISFMAKSRYPQLVSMYGIAITELRTNKLQCCIIMELMNQDLEDYIFGQKNTQKRSLQNKIKILNETAAGVSFLHKQEIVHRDLKPKNILLDDSLNAKITDLGIAKALEDKEKTLNATIAFTARYVSKETAVEEVTSFASDIWSLGLVMYETITEKRCWEGLSSNKIIISLAKQANPFQEGWEQIVQNTQIVQLIKQCCDYNPEKRPKAHEVQQILESIKI